jgi:hypothetical protein
MPSLTLRVVGGRDEGKMVCFDEKGSPDGFVVESRDLGPSRGFDFQPILGFDVRFFSSHDLYANCGVSCLLS